MGRCFGEDEASLGPGLLGSLPHFRLRQLFHFYNKLSAFPNCFTSINRSRGKIRTFRLLRETISGTACKKMLTKK